MSQDKTQQLRQALAAALGSEGNEEFIDKILATLHKEKIIRYHNENNVNLLSTPGRVLVGLIEDSSHTHRSLAIYLNLSETMIDKTIKSLVINGLITKTKQNRQNTYKIQQKLLLNHPDIIHLLAAIGLIVGNSGVATEDLF